MVGPEEIEELNIAGDIALGVMEAVSYVGDLGSSPRFFFKNLRCQMVYSEANLNLYIVSSKSKVLLINTLCEVENQEGEEGEGRGLTISGSPPSQTPLHMQPSLFLPPLTQSTPTFWLRCHKFLTIPCCCLFT